MSVTVTTALKLKPLNLVVFLGSTRTKRANDKVADFVLSRVKENEDFADASVTVIDPRDSYDG